MEKTGRSGLNPSMHVFGSQRPTLKQEVRRLEALCTTYQLKLKHAQEAVQYLAKILDENKIDPLKYSQKVKDIFEGKAIVEQDPVL